MGTFTNIQIHLNRQPDYLLSSGEITSNVYLQFVKKKQISIVPFIHVLIYSCSAPIKRSAISPATNRAVLWSGDHVLENTAWVDPLFYPVGKIISMTNSAHSGNVSGRQCQTSTD